MIWKVETLLEMDEFKDMNRDMLELQLEAIESLIRSYTNNNFQNRIARLRCPSLDEKLYGVSPFFKVGDTIEISSPMNAGLYTIVAVDGEFTTLDRPLYNSAENIATKVEYPADIRKGVLDMLIWQKDSKQKVGIQSETIGRHSVTYFSQEKANSYELGYPTSILGFLTPYKKARF